MGTPLTSLGTSQSPPLSSQLTPDAVDASQTGDEISRRPAAGIAEDDKVCWMEPAEPAPLAGHGNGGANSPFAPTGALVCVAQLIDNERAANASDAAGGRAAALHGGDRKLQIQQWLKGSPDAETIHAALTGKSPLGTLTSTEQRELIDRSLPNWDLQRLVRNDPALKIMFGERLAASAARLLQQPPAPGQDRRAQAKGNAVSMLSELGEDKAALAKALQGLTPEQGALFVQALGNEPNVSRLRCEVLAALNAAAPSPTTSAIVQNIYAQTLVTNVAEMPMGPNPSSFRHELAWALAREWHPGADAAMVRKRDAEATRLEGLMSNSLPGRPSTGQKLFFMGTLDQRVAALEAVRSLPPIPAGAFQDWNGEPASHPAVAKALAEHIVSPEHGDWEAEVRRFTGIVQIEQGRELLYGKPGSGVPPQALAQAREVLLNHPEITAETLRNPPQPSIRGGKNPWFVSSAWCNPAVIAPIARANAASITSDAPMPMGPGKNVDNFVGRAMNAEFKLPSGLTEEQVESGLAAGTVSYYAAGRDAESIDRISGKIREIGGDNPEVTLVPVTYSSDASGAVQLPLFRVRTAEGDKFVDNRGAAYDNFDHWRTANKLPPGVVFYPEGGHNGAELVSQYTPKTPDTAGEKVATAFDYAALAGGTIAGVAIVVGTGGAALAVVGTGAAIWGVARGGQELWERHDVGLSINPFADGEARSVWLGLAANATGVGAFASEMKLLQLAKSGRALSQGAASVIGGMRVGANIFNAAAVANEAINLARNWDRMTPEERARVGLNLAFSAVTTAIAARGARSFGELIDPRAAARAATEAHSAALAARPTAVQGNPKPEVKQTTGMPGIMPRRSVANENRTTLPNPRSPEPANQNQTPQTVAKTVAVAAGAERHKPTRIDANKPQAMARPGGPKPPRGGQGEHPTVPGRPSGLKGPKPSGTSSHDHIRAGEPEEGSAGRLEQALATITRLEANRNSAAVPDGNFYLAYSNNLRDLSLAIQMGEKNLSAAASGKGSDALRHALQKAQNEYKARVEWLKTEAETARRDLVRLYREAGGKLPATAEVTQKQIIINAYNQAITGTDTPKFPASSGPKRPEDDSDLSEPTSVRERPNADDQQPGRLGDLVSSVENTLKARNVSPKGIEAYGRLISNESFNRLDFEAQQAILWEVETHRDVKVITELTRLAERGWFQEASHSDQRRSAALIAFASEHVGDPTIIDNTIDAILSDGARLRWRTLADNIYAEYRESSDTIVINSNYFEKAVTITQERELVRTLIHEVCHFIHKDKPEATYRYFMAEYRAFYVSVLGATGIRPSGLECFEWAMHLLTSNAYAAIGRAARSNSPDSRLIIEFVARIRGDDPQTATLDSVRDESTLSANTVYHDGPEPETPSRPDPNVLNNAVDPNVLTNDIRQRQPAPLRVNRAYIEQLGSSAEYNAIGLNRLLDAMSRAEQTSSLGPDYYNLFEPLAQRLIGLHKAVKWLRRVNTPALMPVAQAREVLDSRIAAWQRVYEQAYNKLQKAVDPHNLRKTPGGEDEAMVMVHVKVLEAHGRVEQYLSEQGEAKTK